MEWSERSANARRVHVRYLPTNESIHESIATNKVHTR
jgi:hypothetical protein